MKITKDNIITLPNKSLRKRSKKVAISDDFLMPLIDDMKSAILDWEASRKHESGVALAAVQIDQLYRVIIVREDLDDKDNNDFICYLNPKIIKYSGEVIYDKEGCLSIADLYGFVPRYEKIKVQAQNLDGQIVRINLSGFMARIFQHEIDHTNGITYADRIGANGTFFSIEDNGELITLDDKQRQQMSSTNKIAKEPVK